MVEKYVYFLTLAEGDGPIKIGCSAVPNRRLHDIMAWSPFRLRILHTFPGGFDMEARIQGRFSDDHLHGEWFAPTKELHGFIEVLKAGEPIENLIDLSKRPRGIAGIRFAKLQPTYPEYQSYRGKFGHAHAKVERLQYWGDERLRRGCRLALSIMESWAANTRYCANRPTVPQLDFVVRVTDHLKSRLQKQLREVA